MSVVLQASLVYTQEEDFHHQAKRMSTYLQVEGGVHGLVIFDAPGLDSHQALAWEPELRRQLRHRG
jgi:hypothetical protein